MKEIEINNTIANKVELMFCANNKIKYYQNGLFYIGLEARRGIVKEFQRNSMLIVITDNADDIRIAYGDLDYEILINIINHLAAK